MSTRRILTIVIAAVLAFSARTVARQDPGDLAQAELDVPKLMPVLGLSAGMSVADVGAGGGAVTIVLARTLGPASRVYATDVNAATVTALRDRAAAAHLVNVVVIAGTQTQTNLPDGCCDAIVVRDAYHHFTDPAAMDRGLLAALKPGGRLAIIDFEPIAGSAPPAGLPPDRTGHGITHEIVAHELETAGFEVVRTIAKWPPGDAVDQYFLVLVKRPPASSRADGLKVGSSHGS